MFDFTDPIEKLIEEDPTIPFVFFDFDGVINMDSVDKKHPSYRQESVYAEDNTPGGWGNRNGTWYLVQWSEPVITQLTQLKETSPYRWVWLTTWMDHTSKLDAFLGIKSDATVYWDSVSYTLKGEELDEFRNRQKVAYIRQWREQNPNTPMVWVDDEATKLWHDSDQNTLVLTPNPSRGLRVEELNRIQDFLTSKDA